MHALLAVIALTFQVASGPAYRVPALPDFAPTDNPHERVERIYESGGDAEVAQGYIILVTLRFTTDDTFSLLADLKAVRFLDIARCNINGSGLVHIVQMKRLEHLRMHDNKFKLEHLKHIGNFPNLTLLYLDNTNIDDTGLAHLSKLRSLVELDLSNTMISDKSVATLASLTKLEELRISETRITPSGFRQLRKLMPNTKVSY